MFMIDKQSTGDLDYCTSIWRVLDLETLYVLLFDLRAYEILILTRVVIVLFIKRLCVPGLVAMNKRSCIRMALKPFLTYASVVLLTSAPLLAPLSLPRSLSRCLRTSLSSRNHLSAIPRSSPRFSSAATESSMIVEVGV